ncbi:MAG TPA: prepilin-type N-terminal cleavage/methylation domain-containing protein [Gemmatirosa sp.]
MTRLPRSRRGARRAPRAGFTLVEVVFAIAMLGGVLLGFAAFTRNFVRATNGASLRATASDLAVERVEAAKAATSYAAIDALAGTETTMADAPPGFARRTIILQTKTAAVDYKTVTVVVTHPALATSVSKTTAIAAF